MKDYQINKLVIDNICSIGTVIEEDVMYFSLEDLLKGLLLERENVKLEGAIVSIKRFDIPQDNGVKKRLDFIPDDELDAFFNNSTSIKCQHIKEGIGKHLYEFRNNYGGVTSNDLLSEESRLNFLEERNNDKKRLDVYKAKFDKYEPLIKTIDNVFGATNSIVVFDQVVSKLKYTKGITKLLIFEELKSAKVFDTDGYPMPHYVDSGYFKVFNISTQKCTTKKVKQSVFVCPKGIKLIEELIDKRYGAKDGK